MTSQKNKQLKKLKKSKNNKVKATSQEVAERKINMHDISFKKMLTKTTVEIDAKLIDTFYEKYFYEAKNKYVPPLFDEFVIKIIDKNQARNYVYQFLCESSSKFLFLSQQEKNAVIDDYMKKHRLINDKIDYIYCKYNTATDWNLIFVDGSINKKIMNAEIHYTNENEGSYKSSVVFYSEPDTEELSQEQQDLFNSTLLLFLSISDYVQNHSSNIEYSQIEVEPVKRDDKKKKIYNNGYSQKIRLKSKQKKYIFTTETQKAPRQYKKVKACWYVRGYYQHFGKEKVLKYIPPRINRRDKNKLNKPKNSIYEVIE